ncbi:MAG: DUF547 domain-containing protein [Woeseiaceae bacterium]
MKVIAIIIAGAIAVAAVMLWANRPLLIVIPASPADDFPANGFSHDQFERLLETWVDTNGQVDYAGWHDDPTALADLDTYLAAVSTWSPESSPDRFPTPQDELAYWMYGYNAYVIRGVLANWPVSSVTDVKAPIEAVKGLGFFARQRFSFGGEPLSLYHVENVRIRKAFRDPRVHFVLNCASETCPVIRPALPAGADLEPLLESAATDFINDPRNVAVDHDERTIYLSAIFGWYEKDYLNWLRATGRPVSDGLVDYISVYASAELATDLESAADYEVHVLDFDWTLNASNATH